MGRDEMSIVDMTNRIMTTAPYPSTIPSYSNLLPNPSKNTQKPSRGSFKFLTTVQFYVKHYE